MNDRRPPDVDVANVEADNTNAIRDAMTSNPAASAFAMTAAAILIGGRPQFNDAQRRRLEWLRNRNGPGYVWTAKSQLPAKCRFAVVIEPPNGIQLERLLAALADDAVVVVPCGEDPAYDRLKSRLVAFGTVGVGGATGPHQMWWGGPRPLVPRPLSVGAGSPDTASAVLTVARRTGQACDESPLESPPLVPDTPVRDGTLAECILTKWQSNDDPVIWIDGGFRSPADMPEIEPIDCDFAVFKRHRWLFDTDLLYFGRRHPAGVLLRAWAVFCRQFPGLDARILLDQAWCLVTSQLSLDTFWLPSARDRGEALPGSSPTVDRGEYSDLEFHGDACPADQFLRGRLKTARAAGRTGFPEVLLSVPAASGSDKRAIAIIRDVDVEESYALGTLIEALAQAFATDPGGFRQLEIAICTRREDLYAALQSAPVDRALVVTPKHRIAADTFRRLAEANEAIVIAPASVVVDLGARRNRLVTAEAGSETP
jgi:hypothetical protein